MRENIVEGLLLCSECENQLRVDVYNKKLGFFRVYPCVHCATELDLKRRGQVSLPECKEVQEFLEKLKVIQNDFKRATEEVTEWSRKNFPDQNAGGA